MKEHSLYIENMDLTNTRTYSGKRIWRNPFGFPGSSASKESPVRFLGQEDPLEKGIGYPLQYSWASLVAQLVKNLPAMQETWVWSLGWEIPWRKEQLPTPVFWPGEFHGLYSPWGCKESDKTEQLSLSLWRKEVWRKLLASKLRGWRRQWHPTPVLFPWKSHGWRSLVGCSPWGREVSAMTERLHFHFSLWCIGEGNGNPLQCSCLENPRDGVAQSRTRLKWLSSNKLRGL